MTTKKWTILAYFSGDNNLSDRGVEDINEMAKVGSNDDLNIVAQFDRAGNWGTHRFYITEDGGYEKDVIQELGQTNMGDPKVLEDFLTWGIKNYPAKYYMLTLWGHGTGWIDEDIHSLALKSSPKGKSLSLVEKQKIKEVGMSGIKKPLFSTSIEKILKLPEDQRLWAFGNDDGSNDFLDLIELKKVLSSALKKSKVKKFDIIGFDACLMNTLEVCYQIKDSADIFVGSEEEEPPRGWPFEKILKTLSEKPDTIPITLATTIVDEYVKSYDTDESYTVTQSAVNLKKINEVKKKVDQLADKLIDQIKNKDLFDAITDSFNDSKLYSYSKYIDLYNFAELLGEKIPSDEVRAKVQELKIALEISQDSYVVASKKLDREKEKNAHSVSIYFVGGSLYSYFYDKLEISKKGKWNKFLKAYKEEIGPIVPD